MASVSAALQQNLCTVRARYNMDESAETAQIRQFGGHHVMTDFMYFSKEAQM